MIFYITVRKGNFARDDGYFNGLQNGPTFKVGLETRKAQQELSQL